MNWAGSLRLQAEFGGEDTKFDPLFRVLEKAKSILKCVPDPIRYARVDGVVRGDRFLLLELERLESELHFR